MILDDGLGIEFGFSKFETTSKCVLNTLVDTALVTNKESVDPNQLKFWLGISVNLNKGCFYVSEERISNLL